MEHIALYRQFRPQTFDDIVEQETAVTTLRQTVISGKIGHAYLFCGTRGTGKTTIAKVFSRAINCEHPINGNPCNECAICKGVLESTLMDVIEIDAASNNSVDNIRKICEEVVYAPSKAPYKVYIIDEVHMLSSGAFNALLKTLEEPPKHAVFLLATTEPHKIPATILSRCQRFDFKRISLDAIVKRLSYICAKESIPAEDDALKLIATLADGALRDSISLLDQAQSAASILPNGNKKTITAQSIEEITGTVDTRFLYNMADTLIKGNYEKLLPLCDELFKSGRDLTRFSIDLGGYFRDLLVVRMMPDPTQLVTASPTTLKAMYNLASNCSAETLVAFISYISNLVSELKWSPSIRTTFEISLLRLCGRKVKTDIPPLVVPDFVKKQAKAAEEISARLGSSPSISESDTAKPEEVVTPSVKDEPKPNDETTVKEDKKPDDKALNKEETQVKSEEKDTSKTDDKADAKPKEEATSEIEPKIEPEVKIEDKKEDTPSKETSETSSSEDKKEEVKNTSDTIKSSDEETKSEVNPDIPTKPTLNLGSGLLGLNKPSIFANSLSSLKDKKEEPVVSTIAQDPNKSFAETVASNPDIPEEEKPMENQMDLFSMAGITESKPKNTSERKSKLSQFSSGTNLFSTPINLEAKKKETEAKKDDDGPALILEEIKPSEEANESKPSRRSMIADVYESTKDLPEFKTPKEEEADTAPSSEAEEAPSDIDAIWNGVIKSFTDEDYPFYLQISTAKVKVSDNKFYMVFEGLNGNSIKELIALDSCKKMRDKLKAVLPEYSFYMCTLEQYNQFVGKSNNAAPVNQTQASESKNTENNTFADYVNKKNAEEGLQSELDFGEDW